MGRREADSFPPNDHAGFRRPSRAALPPRSTRVGTADRVLQTDYAIASLDDELAPAGLLQHTAGGSLGLGLGPELLPLAGHLPPAAGLRTDRYAGHVSTSRSMGRPGRKPD